MKGVDAVEIPATLVRRLSHEGLLKKMGMRCRISAKGESEKSYFYDSRCVVNHKYQFSIHNNGISPTLLQVRLEEL